MNMENASNTARQVLLLETTKLIQRWETRMHSNVINCCSSTYRQTLPSSYFNKAKEYLPVHLHK